MRRALMALLTASATTPAFAQEMEPKAYSASPVGATFFVASLSRSTGSVVFDPTLPITDAEATIGGAVLGVGRTFGLFGKLSLVSAALPYAWGEASGVVGGGARRVTRSGLADTRLRLSINLRGNPALPLRQYVTAPRRTIIGASLTAQAPTGQYDGTKLINLGANRWAFKPEVGLAVPRGRWDIDAYAGVWFFTGNPDFYPGRQARSQKPVVALQAHVSYTFRPRLWLAVDMTRYQGGASQVGNGPYGADFGNARLGATLSLPVGRQQSIKISYGAGVVVRTGTDFRTIAVGYQWLWFQP